MFRDQVTGELSEPNEPAVRVVVERRVRQYVNENGKRSQGYETVREVLVREHTAERMKEAG